MSQASRLLFAVVGMILFGSPLSSQEQPLGTIAGSILDAENLQPLPGATVYLEMEGPESAPRSQGPAATSFALSSVSDSRGAYRFERLPPGRYRLRIDLMGYRQERIGVDLRGSAISNLSVGLTVRPIALAPISVEGEATRNPYGRDTGLEQEIDGSRSLAARSRQEAYLASDVIGITHADVLEAVTLGETDILRALQRSPGIVARDDFGAEFWVRGAAWDQTRILFDGIPILNPLHAFGLLSAVNTDAIGGSLLHPGAMPASLAGGASAVLDITSRAGATDERLKATSDLSLASGRIAMDGSFRDGRATWMVAGRRSWIDLATSAVSLLAGDEGTRLPYSFSDVTGRVDLRLAGHRTVEVSGLHSSDRISGTLPDIIHRTRATWGNSLARATFEAPLASLRTRTTFGFSRHGGRVHEGPADPEVEQRLSAASIPPSRNLLNHVSLQSEARPRSAGTRSWRVGFGIHHDLNRYDGPRGYIYDRLTPEPGDSALSRRGSITFGALWGERNWSPNGRVTLQTGIRMEAGPAVRNGGLLRLMPRIIGRYRVNDDISFSFGAGRTFQYMQSLAGTGPAVTPAYAANSIWVIADDETPAVRADIATVGTEAWIGRDWLLAANAYYRHSTGVALTNAGSGPLADRPLFVTGENFAHGFEVSARRLGGRWTASGSYSLGTSDMEAAGERFPASEDRRHALHLTSMYRLGESLRFGGAFSFASGAPYTRIYAKRYLHARKWVRIHLSRRSAERSPLSCYS